MGGIGQTFYNLVNFLEKNNLEKVKIVGVDVTSEPNSSDKGIYYKSTPSSVLKVVSVNLKTPYFGDVIQTVSNIDEIKDTYSELIDTYISIIKKEKPSLILINGTYFVPWCLFQAGNQLGIPMVLHYHGILTKETSHYAPELHKLIKEMETTFDNDKLLYIFPSKLAKTVVEEEVFGHKISRTAIIPNAIPNHFFKIKTSGNKRDVAFVSRWSTIKNPNFIKKITRYDQKNNRDYCFNVVSDKKDAQKRYKNILENIKFYDPMNSSKLARFYGKMGVVISPSFFETYGNVAQEAIATGTPALVGPNMGVAELFRELGLSQYIVDFKSTKNVYEKIKNFSGQMVSDKIRKMMKYNLTPHAVNSRYISALKSA
ncbi:MAG: glycosyltransferase family 4 protein [Candidatus Shapirobacteria bacterium]|nr:glycosyltransferase family 4 protein [Candidatus Shapirobacteria bacterium]